MNLEKAIKILKQHNDSRRLGTEKVHPINLSSAIDVVIKHHGNLFIDNSEIKEVELYNKREIEILSLESKRIFESGISLSYQMNALKRKDSLTEKEKHRLESYKDKLCFDGTIYFFKNASLTKPAINKTREQALKEFNINIID